MQIDRRICVAPMMDCTDRHDRYFLRLISPHALLYTEMITTQALIHGDVNSLLAFHPLEHPVALQLGGSDPKQLAHCAKMGEDFGYDEINLNVGCPSSRVTSGRFGACLMQEPNLVADCVHAMQSQVSIPVTVKCRIGVDDNDSYEALSDFISLNEKAGCHVFIVHARKAWLKGLSPKQNREIPPLRYDVVHQLKKDFPQLELVINGGFKHADEIMQQLTIMDGVMIGREAYSNPYLLAELESKIFADKENILTRKQVLENYLPYVASELKNNVKLISIARHLFGLYQGIPGARAWRRYISENAHQKGANEDVLIAAMQNVKE